MIRQLVCAGLLCVAVVANAFASDDRDHRSRWISAISADNTSALRTLLADADDKSLLSVTASNGKTALMVACKVGDDALAKTLVEQGVDIGDQTITNGTAFMFAVLGDQKPIAEWLVGLGADINARGSNGWTGVMIASAKGLDQTLEWLLAQGANAQTPDVYGFSPLMRASDNGHTAAARLLLLNDGVDVHWQDELENTALHYAVSGDHYEIVDLLLAAGADRKKINRANLSPLDLANTAAVDSTVSEQRRIDRMSMLQALQKND